MTKNTDVSETEVSATNKTELGQYRLWTGLLRARLLDEVSASFQPAPEELESAWQGFCKKFQIDP